MPKKETQRRKKKRKLQINLPPMFDDAVHAGFPSPASDYIDGHLDLNEYMIKRPSSTFFVKVAGDSMINASIQEGDVLVVDRSLEAVNKNIVLAIIDGEFTVKRLIKNGNTIELHPENSKHKIIRVTEDIDFEIWGVVTFIIHQAK